MLQQAMPKAVLKLVENQYISTILTGSSLATIHLAPSMPLICTMSSAHFIGTSAPLTIQTTALQKT